MEGVNLRKSLEFERIGKENIEWGWAVDFFA